MILSIILQQVLNISVIQCIHSKNSLMYGSSWDRGHFMDKLCSMFRHSLEHYLGTTRTTDIQLWLWVHQQICCDKISSIAVESINEKSCFNQLIIKIWRAFIHALWIMDPSKRATGLNMQPSPQKKGSARVTSMLCVTDNKLGLIPHSLRKGLQL